MSGPRIGLSARITRRSPDDFGIGGKQIQYLEQSIANALAKVGALVLMIPSASTKMEVTTDAAFAARYADALDGLVLQGGVDIFPRHYGSEARAPLDRYDPERDLYELNLIDAFHRRGKPVLGICRGMQLINVFAGGTLHQDISVDISTQVLHYCPFKLDEIEHEIEIESGGRLDVLFGSGRKLVNSLHHQAIDRLGSKLAVEALSPLDGVIEAIRCTSADYLVGVQWHPEFDSPREGLLNSTALFSDFCSFAEQRLRT